MKEKKEKKGLLIKIGDFITDKRYIILAIFIAFSIFCLCNINNVEINDSIVSYLPNDTETKQGLDIMEEEFDQLNTIKLMVSDISLEEANKLVKEISNIDNIQSVQFDGTETSYKDNKALYTIIVGNIEDEEIEEIKNNIEDTIKEEKYDLYSELFEKPTDGINIALISAIIVIIIILIITSKTYFEPIIAFIIFGISIILNMGTNFIFGEISYITKSIAVILQLALSIDYVIIFMNQYMKEISDTDDKILAIKKTISKSISEIFASSLTTISGLLALAFMHLKIGEDIGLVLSKGILCSLLTVILVMPSLLSIFNKYILKFKKKEKESKSDKIGQIIFKGRKILLPVFLILVIISIFISTKYNYVYNTTTASSINQSNNTISHQNIEEEFGTSNNIVILIKNNNKDYTKELELSNELLSNKNITSVTSLGSYYLNDNIALGTEINYLELSQLFNIDSKTTLDLYKYYATLNNETNNLENIDTYKISIINLLCFLNQNKETLQLPQELSIQIENYYNVLSESISLLESDNYSRIILNINLQEEGEKTEKAIEEIRSITENYYDNVILVGNSINAIDLKSSFTADNIIITLITIIFIAIILLFTFKSIPMTLLLIFTIEGSVFINFGLITLLGKEIFFMSYIVVSAIQMGATIDYAIVIASRYKQLRNKTDKKEAIVETLNDRLPAVITSGLILLIAGFLIGFISKNSVISSIGLFLGTGTLISLIATIFVLPALLYLFDKIIIKK
ncbi:MAG: RND family transporter [Candidatus Coprovivens sp.]